MAAPIRLTGSWVAEAVRGRIVSGDVGREAQSASIDTRTMTPGALYLGIHGERFDGADFAGDAIAKGAAGVVVPAGRGGALDAGTAFVIEVGDTTEALQALGREVRRQSGARLVAITGSAGKTTTKEITADFLAARYRVIRNRGNFNNHIGLPLSLIDLRERPEIAVVELGMNHAGEISTLVRIAEPDVRVWTNVGEAHLGFFASVDRIADAKAEILEGASGETVLVANADDERVMSRVAGFCGRTVTFGVEHQADVRGTGVVDRGIHGLSARVATPHGEVQIETSLAGRSNLLNLLAATAVATVFDVPLERVAERARRLRPAPHRGEIVTLSRATVIDDSYNANPTATRMALDLLAHDGSGARRVAFLGEMLELGDHSTALHQEVGRAAARAGLDRLIAVGGRPAAALADAAVEAGLDRARVTYVATSDDAADIAARLIEPGSLVLVKGSRGIRTDRIVERLKAELA